MPQEQGSEKAQPAVQEPLKINRRRLIGNTAKAILGTAAAIPLAREIKQIVEQKVETSEGIFYPLYEFHESPIEKLPDKVDIYWREGIGGEEFLTSDAYFDPKGLIKKGLYERGARVAFGDVDYRPQDLSKDSLKATSALISASLMAIVPATAGLAIGNLLEKNSQARKVTRRVVLGGLAAAAFSATGLNLSARERAIVDRKNVPYLNTAEVLNISNPSGDPVGRAIVKLEGLISDFHPEIAVQFFRNAIWAHKLLEYSKALKKDLGRKPNFALAIGAAHAGVEEFLILGEPFIEACISAYPKEWLSEVMKTNGGIEQFSTIRITQQLHSPTEVPTLKDADIFVDKSLVDTLTKKLS